MLRGLPHTYRNIAAQTGTAIAINVGLEQPFFRYLIKNQEGWKIENDHSGSIDSAIIIPAGTAWKLFTRAIRPEEARENVTMEGDVNLAETALTLIAVIA
ncbi:hypothetical protein [Dyadobacter sp. CY347]|uniref:hypothetical protein n=1 Tax=Dyadobacter sp. CY347 TaxID=2909336 RepID=UPI001F4263B4|nr:hypothetical protein [Dyadobacter sp. CY347]MCF2490915.1 hypothetical protein [Dyadobacter sp. CY347]